MKAKNCQADNYIALSITTGGSWGESEARAFGFREPFPEKVGMGSCRFIFHQFRGGFLKRSLIAGAGLALSPACSPPRAAWMQIPERCSQTISPPMRLRRARHHHEPAFANRVRIARAANRPAGVFVVGDCAFNSGEKATTQH